MDPGARRAAFLCAVKRGYGRCPRDRLWGRWTPGTERRGAGGQPRWNRPKGGERARKQPRQEIVIRPSAATTPDGHRQTRRAGPWSWNRDACHPCANRLGDSIDDRRPSRSATQRRVRDHHRQGHPMPRCHCSHRALVVPVTGWSNGCTAQHSLQDVRK